MATNPLVSIIVPVYNTDEGYLRACLESIENQSYQNIEVIIVDDGSGERTVKLIDEFLRNNARGWKIIHRENGGLSAARNSGYEIATGKYIQFLDSDDYFDNKLIASVVAKAEETNADVVVENFVVDDYSTGMKHTTLNLSAFPMDIPFKLTDLSRMRMQTIPYTVWSKLFRKKFLDRHQLLHDEHLMRAEDVLFSLTALVFAERIALVSEAYINYRENLPVSNSKSNDKFPLASIESWEKLHALLARNNLHNVYKKDFEEAMLDSVYWHLMRLNTLESSQKLALKARDLITEIDATTINDPAIAIAAASVDPRLLQGIRQKNEHVEQLTVRIAQLEDTIKASEPRKYTPRRVTAAMKRRLQNSMKRKGK